MYHIDPKYLKQRDSDGRLYFLAEEGFECSFINLMNTNQRIANFDDENEVVYDKIISLINASNFFGINLYSARYGDDNKKYALLTENGDELFTYEDGYNYGKNIDQPHSDGEYDASDFKHLLENAVAKEPEKVNVIPMDMYFKEENLAKNILNAYHCRKIEELEALPADADIAKFVEDFNKEVDQMSAVFENVANAKKALDQMNNLTQQAKEM